MSCRSQSDEYKSALTDRFTDLIDPTPFDIQNAEVFEHQPLQDASTELRYLYLLPKTHNIDHDGQAIVRCQLHSDAEEQAPCYIGLSYTWGDPGLRRPILVGDKIFHATVNLAIALEHLQEEEKTITFWIDAICIDQSNLGEKNIQVQRMGSIFTSAALVLAWLGPEADESELALRELMRYSYHCPNSYEELKHTFSRVYTALPFESIDAFFDRPWFKRVWVGQEVALNKHVIFVCGRLDIQREELLVCHGKFTVSRSIWGETKLSAINVRFGAREPLPLRVFLHEHAAIHLLLGSALESSDPRDFIYSSLGRISSLGNCVLDVDYTKRVQDVYTEFAVAVIRAGEVDWLSYGWRLSVNYGDLPSWVPDWSKTRTCGYPQNMILLDYDIVEVCEVEKGGKALNISAQRITQISHIVSNSQSQQEASAFDLSTSAMATQQDEERVWLSLDTIRQALDDKERWGHTVAERAVFDLSSGLSIMRDVNYKDPPHYVDLYKSYKAFRGLETLPSDMTDLRQWARDTSRDYLSVIRQPNIENLFVTAADIVGTSRDGVQPGDWVCVLGGVRGAWILREVDDGFYRIVSFANVFPWGDVENSDAPVETITIV